MATARIVHACVKTERLRFSSQKNGQGAFLTAEKRAGQVSDWRKMEKVLHLFKKCLLETLMMKDNVLLFYYACLFLMMTQKCIFEDRKKK